MDETPPLAPKGFTRLRRISGLSLVLSSLLTLVALIPSFQLFGQMEVLWFICHYFRYLGPAALLIGASLLLPELWKSASGTPFWLLCGLLSWVILIGAAGIGWFYARPMLGHTWSMRELGDPGPYEAVVLEASGRTELDSTVWARPSGAGRFERIASPDYPPCQWPIEVRRSPEQARYLIVDSRMWAVALYDLNSPGLALILEDLPPLDDLRREFGDDLKLVSTFDAADGLAATEQEGE